MPGPRLFIPQNQILNHDVDRAGSEPGADSSLSAPSTLPLPASRTLLARERGVFLPVVFLLCLGAAFLIGYKAGQNAEKKGFGKNQTEYALELREDDQAYLMVFRKNGDPLTPEIVPLNIKKVEDDGE